MSDLLVTAARLFDGANVTESGGAFVAMDGASVTAVGPTGALGSDWRSQHANVLELGDATLMPGLINMHTHMSFSGGDSVFHDATHDSDPLKMLRIAENLRAALATGVTTIRDCGTAPHLALTARQAVTDGLLAGPRIIASGAVTTTGGHCWYCATEADDEAAVRRAVRAHVKQGVDFIKLFATGGNLTPGTNSIAAQFTEQELCAATEEARRLGRRTASHAHGTEGVRNSIAARVTTIEHCSFQNEQGIGWDAGLAGRVADEGIFVCPTVFRGLAKLADDPSYHFSQAQEVMLTRRHDRLALVRRLADAGVRLVAGNDAGVIHCNFSDFPHDLVLTSEAAGFTPLEVLCSATSVAAEALGHDHIGTLAVGKAADVLAVAGDPSTDIRAVTHPRLVIAGGQVVRQVPG